MKPVSVPTISEKEKAAAFTAALPRGKLEFPTLIAITVIIVAAMIVIVVVIVIMAVIVIIVMVMAVIICRSRRRRGCAEKQS